LIRFDPDFQPFTRSAQKNTRIDVTQIVSLFVGGDLTAVRKGKIPTTAIINGGIYEIR
jgi:hypothetical protein